MKTIVTKPSPDQNVNFRLFQINDAGGFLKLDTRNGVITQIEYMYDGRIREYELNPTPLVDKEDEKPGRFFLYPTEWISGLLYLLDQISGNCYQVQIDKKDRGVWRIY